MFKLFLTTLLILIYVSLIGCGTTGPLYIPEQRYPQEETPNVTPAETPTKETN